MAKLPLPLSVNGGLEITEQLWAASARGVWISFESDRPLFPARSGAGASAGWAIRGSNATADVAKPISILVTVAGKDLKFSKLVAHAALPKAWTKDSMPISIIQGVISDNSKRFIKANFQLFLNRINLL